MADTFEGEGGRAWVLATRPFLTLGEGPLSGGRGGIFLCYERGVKIRLALDSYACLSYGPRRPHELRFGGREVTHSTGSRGRNSSCSNY